MSEKEKNQVQEVKKQAHELRRVWLPKLGFKNIFAETGYEADDIIAQLCKSLSKKEDIIIVSSDQDLYQCLRGHISIYQPQQDKVVTLQKFFKEYGIKPKEWPKVKAWMGDTGDSIPGVYGVGIKKALKYMNCPHDAVILKTKAQKELYESMLEHWKNGNFQRNLDLVTLPWPGTPVFKIKEDKVTKSRWREVCQQLGFETLEKLYPLSVRKKILNEE